MKRRSKSTTGKVTVTFDLRPLDKVKVLPFDCEGLVLSCCIMYGHTVFYNVEYYINGTVNTNYFLINDLLFIRGN